MSDWYTPSGSPATGSTGSSAVIRAEFVAIAAALAKLAGYTGNGGSPLFVNAGGTAYEAANIATAQNRLGIIVSNELNGLANLNAVGIVTRTGNGAYTNRTLTGTANQISVANGNGNAGNPTFSLPNPLNVTDLGLANINVTGTIRGNPAMFSPLNNSLATDVNLNNTSVFFDGPSVAQGSNGTWFVEGKTVVDTGGTGGPNVFKLWDGNTVLDSGNTQGLQFSSITLSGFITNPTGNLRISARCTSSTAAKMVANGSGQGKDSTITAIRIG